MEIWEQNLSTKMSFSNNTNQQMNKILFSILCFSFLFSCDTHKFNDLTDSKLKGNIDSIITQRFEAIEKFGELEKTKLIEDRFSIYTDGFRTKEIVKYDDTSKYINSIYITKYSFDENKSEELSYELNGTLNQRDIIKLNDKKRKVELTSYNSQGEKRKISKFYYADDLLIAVKDFNVDGSNFGRTEYKYDKNKNIVEYVKYSANEYLLEKKINKYNDKNLIKESLVFNNNNFIVKKITYKNFKYDNKENCIYREKTTEEFMEWVIQGISKSEPFSESKEIIEKRIYYNK